MDNEIEVMRIVRVPPMGKLVVEANGNRFEQLADVTNPALKQRLVAAIGELIVFAEGYQTLVDAGVAPPMNTTVPAETAQEEKPQAATEAQRAAFLASLERERDALIAKANLAPDPNHLVSAAAREEPAAPAPDKPLSIVEQIDAILQKHVRAETALNGRSIHLEQAPGGGLRINVDGKVYQRPTEIEEKEVQHVIKTALKEWEAY